MPTKEGTPGQSEHGWTSCWISSFYIKRQWWGSASAVRARVAVRSFHSGVTAIRSRSLYFHHLLVTFVQRSDTWGESLCLDRTDIFPPSPTWLRELEWEWRRGREGRVVVFVWEMAGGRRGGLQVQCKQDWPRAEKERLFKRLPTDSCSPSCHGLPQRRSMCWKWNVKSNTARLKPDEQTFMYYKNLKFVWLLLLAFLQI